MKKIYFICSIKIINLDLNSQFKKFKKFKNIVLIGMGGSILGTEAIFNFLKQKIKNYILLMI